MENVIFANPGQFFGVYILYNVNPKYKGQIYIGFTVNPARRIRQHNREIKGGAWKTGRNKGPWDMVLIIHGFPTKIAALQFEWAWQNPSRSVRLKQVLKKERKESQFSYRIRVLSEMLNLGPWKRLALTIHWLKQQYQLNFPLERPPPLHMPISYGEIFTGKSSMDGNMEDGLKEHIIIKDVEKCCSICNERFEDERFLKCIVKTCSNVSHTICLAQLFLTQSGEIDTEILPVQGSCPKCNTELLWGHIVKMNRCRTVNNEVDSDDDIDEEDENGANSDSDFNNDGLCNKE